MILFGYEIKKTTPQTIDTQIYKDVYGNNVPILLKLGGGEPHPMWKSYTNEYFFKKDEITLPYKDKSVEAIYISDLIEHMPILAVYNLFKECLRVLKRYGHLRVSTLDIMLFYYAKMNNDKLVFDHIPNFKDYSVNQLFLNEFATQRSEVCYMDSLSDEEIDKAFENSNTFDVLDHITTKNIDITQQKITDKINWFNLTKLHKIFENLGCKSIFYSQYGHSNVPVMRDVKSFDAYLPTKSLYIEVRKS